MVDVLSFTYGFSQSTNIYGTPSEFPVFDGLNLVIESQKDLKLAAWAFAQNESKQLELLIPSRFPGGKTHKLKLFDCHLVGWKMSFSSKGTHPLRETLKISCAGFGDSNYLEVDYLIKMGLNFSGRIVDNSF